jgi:cardiolipin synthase
MWVTLMTVLLSLPATDVQPIPNRDYVPALLQVLDRAQHTIDIFMYIGRYYPQYPNDANSRIINALIRARQRGVRVRILLDASSWNTSNSLQNKAFGDSLKRAGIEIYYDQPDVTSHDKLIIVDTMWTIVGSTNWSYYALERNNEASVLIESRPVAQSFLEYFEDALRFATEDFPVLEE